MFLPFGVLAVQCIGQFGVLSAGCIVFWVYVFDVDIMVLC
jgi:hypothetical protein